MVGDLLDAGIDLDLAIASSIFEDTAEGRALLDRLGERCPIRIVGPGILRDLAPTTQPQGVLVVARAPAAELAAQETGGSGVVLVLDAVQDPGNLGTLLRTADAFGVRYVALLPGTVDPWNPKVVRASAGSVFRVPVVSTDRDALLGWLRAHEFTILAADASGEPFDDVDVPLRSALVVGNEGAGLHPELAAAAQRLVGVPVRPGTESLNVGVAAGILLHHLTTGR